MTWNYLWVIWLFSLFYLRFDFFGFVHARRFIARLIKRRFNTPEILFQVTTRGNIPVVQKTVDRINEVCSEIGYTKYGVWIVSEVNERLNGCRTITVPKDYRCNALYKARALQYAVELRRTEGKNSADIYTLHLDDESLISKQTLCSILSYIEGDPSPVSEGLITYPIQRDEGLRITHFFDTLRPFSCFECIHFMDNGKPAHIHGSNLLLRSDIEEKVGWDNGFTIAEDTLFAIKARLEIGEKSFGWHGGVLEESSPFTLGDLVKQRKRWFYGFLQNLKYFPARIRLSQIAWVIIWLSGFPSGIVSVVAFFVPQYIPPPISTMFFYGTILWLMTYQIGALMNSKYLPPLKRLFFHLLMLILTPIIGIMECSIPFIALLSRPKSFEVVRK